MSELELLRADNERLQAENVDLRSHYVHISVVADLMDALKEAKKRLDEYSEFIKCTSQSERFSLWQCDSILASACAQSQAEHGV